MEMSRAIRGRFAPSPSGRLHLGNMASSLLAWLDARSLGGEIIFRLEDLDPERSYMDCARLMAEDLRWLGLDWDSGWPEDDGFAQGGRTAFYRGAFEELGRRGLLYRCWCSRAERLAASAPHPGEEQPGSCKCRRLAGAELAARDGREAAAGLQVRRPGHGRDHHRRASRANTRRTSRATAGTSSSAAPTACYAYQLAVSVDDALMGVTRVVRAEDLLSSAPRQKWLIETLGYAAPEYAHAPLLTAPDGRKLSKRDGDLQHGRAAPGIHSGGAHRAPRLPLRAYRPGREPVPPRELIARLTGRRCRAAR